MQKKKSGGLKKIHKLTICCTSKEQNINPLKSEEKQCWKNSEQFIPVSSCLHEVPLAMANPVFLVVE